MSNKVISKIGALAVSAVVLSLPTTVSADEIALTFEDLEVTISGEFAGFQQNAYVIITENGPLHVPAAYVSCEGLSCFEFASSEES
jgi:hypothetical protein